jgi:putative hydrolase of HD superfamily
MEDCAGTQFIHGVLGFIRSVENLKNTERFAFTSKGRRESVAEHSWRLALFAYVISSKIEGVDREKLLALALVHDLGETYCGDIPATKQTSDDGKEDCERKCMQELCALLPDGVGDEMLALWEEYESCSSLEALLVKGLDKIETLLQNVQGLNPDDFDYQFNLNYARKHTDTHQILRKLREIVDMGTECRMCINLWNNGLGDNKDFSEHMHSKYCYCKDKEE